jgi:hypothetical protein
LRLWIADGEDAIGIENIIGRAERSLATHAVADDLGEPHRTLRSLPIT